MKSMEILVVYIDQGIILDVSAINYARGWQRNILCATDTYDCIGQARVVGVVNLGGLRATIVDLLNRCETL